MLYWGSNEYSSFMVARKQRANRPASHSSALSMWLVLLLDLFSCFLGPPQIAVKLGMVLNP